MTEFTEWRSLVDGERITGIPDSVADQTVHLYDARELSLSNNDTVSSLPDLEGSNDLSADGDPTFDTSGINENPAVFYDGDDAHESSSISVSSYPITVIAVVSLDTINDRHTVIQMEEGGSNYIQYRDDNSEWFIFGGSDGISGSSDTTVQLVTAIFDDDDSEFREDGSQTATGNVGSRDADVLYLGGDRGDFGPRRELIGHIGLARVIDGTVPTEDLQEYESQLISEWGI